MSRDSSRPRSALFVTGLTCLALLSWPSRARCDDPKVPTSLELDWEAPDGCSARDATLSNVERLLGTPIDPSAAPLRARAKVNLRPGGGWRLRLVFAAAGGERTRELDARTCDELSQAAAVILALALNPSLGGDFAAPGVDESMAPSAGASTDSARTPPMVADAAPSDIPPQASSSAATARGHGPSEVASASWHWTFGAGSVLALGAIPSPAFGVAIHVAVAHGRIRLELAGLNLVERFAHIDERDTAGGYIGLREGTLSGCYLLSQGRVFAAGGCAQIEVGTVYGHGQGLDHLASGGRLWLSTGLSGVFSFEVASPLFLVVEPAIGVPWGRPEFEAAGASVYQPWFVTGSLRSTIEVRFF